MKIYLDGCSLTYCQGLDRNLSIGHMLKNNNNCQLLDKSLPSKSNFAIVQDTWNNRFNYDIFILGFTYSDRITINFRDKEFHLHPSKNYRKIDYQKFHDASIEESLAMIHKGAYSLYEQSFYKNQSDCMVDMLITKLKSLEKIVIPFSWEKRNTDWEIFYPIYGQEYRISESDQHLNQKGATDLCYILQTKMIEQIHAK